MSIFVWLLLILIVAWLIYGAMQPNTFRIERSAIVNAPPERIYALIDDFRRWREWSPWEDLDPNLQRTYAGPEHGPGASYQWSGNGKAGAGRMEITEAEAPGRVLINLDFEKPFKASNKAEFTLTEADGGTRVNWAMYGSLNMFMRMLHLVFNMGKMVGPDFERGLRKLKEASERAAK